MSADSLKDRTALVVGLGVSGYAAAETLLEEGAVVRVTEAANTPEVETRAEALRAKGIEVETGGHDLDGIDCDLAIVSPGIPTSSAIITALGGFGGRSDRRDRARLPAGRLRPPCRDRHQRENHNDRSPRSDARGGRDHLDGRRQHRNPRARGGQEDPSGGAIALEVSSFQLSTITSFRPVIAVMLNVAEDHTDWHGSFDAYAADKARITENQRPEDVFLPNAEDPRAWSMSKSTRAKVVPFSATRPRRTASVSPPVGSCGRGKRSSPPRTLH